MKTKIIILLLLMSLSTMTFSAVTCTNNSCVGPASELIDQLFSAKSNGEPYVLITSSISVNSLPCSGVSGGLNIRLSSNGDGRVAFEETFSLLMMATASNAKIRLRIFESQSTCELFYAAVLP